MSERHVPAAWARKGEDIRVSSLFRLFEGLRTCLARGEMLNSPDGT